MKFKKAFSVLFITLVVIAFSTIVNAQDATKPVATVTWKSTTIDLGKIEQGKPVTVEFEFTNPSMIPLIINSVKPTCGCTIADYPKEPIQPGKSGKITATYNAAASGPFNKTVVVSSNAADGNTALVIKGEVVPKQ
jgi:hypothetical protein